MTPLTHLSPLTRLAAPALTALLLLACTSDDPLNRLSDRTSHRPNISTSCGDRDSDSVHRPSHADRD